jgi:Enoyl-(Acyl carrier protein) reductase
MGDAEPSMGGSGTHPPSPGVRTMAIIVMSEIDELCFQIRAGPEEHSVQVLAANDVANDGISANAVLPGLTNTQATALQSEEQKRSTWGQQAIKRLGEPEDVTGAVLFLTSDDAAFITGQAIVVDGGLVDHAHDSVVRSR